MEEERFFLSSSLFEVSDFRRFYFSYGLTASLYSAADIKFFLFLPSGTVLFTRVKSTQKTRLRSSPIKIPCGRSRAEQARLALRRTTVILCSEIRNAFWAYIRPKRLCGGGSGADFCKFNLAPRISGALTRRPSLKDPSHGFKTV